MCYTTVYRGINSLTLTYTTRDSCITYNLPQTQLKELSTSQTFYPDFWVSGKGSGGNWERGKENGKRGIDRNLEGFDSYNVWDILTQW